ncbi:hypothetical protein JVX98_19385 [Ensifer sp. PDNC004]|uniref:hypothetical protein n=1 Tax=Ensifer sp. PDNC004 TaxID=2811423 RepID=UPI001964179C|nr:hypothetical protein [Ensifer sp. PDNC004]QRY66560.1 hypothetical protein JVX98_19385 [Ensifer sp. PDNC004]
MREKPRVPKTERIPIMFEKELIEQVDEFSFQRRIRTRAATLRLLVKIGLAAASIETEKGSVSA